MSGSTASWQSRTFTLARTAVDPVLSAVTLPEALYSEMVGPEGHGGCFREKCTLGDGIDTEVVFELAQVIVMSG